MELGTPVWRNYKSGRLVVLGLLALAAALAVVALLGRPRITLRRQSPPADPVLAVLPFWNLSGEPGLQILGAEVEGSIGEALAATGRVSLVPRDTVRLVELGREGLEEAATTLRADYVIAGSLDEEEGRIVVDVYLFRARPEPALWADRLSWDASEASLLPRELAERIRSAVRRR